MGTGIYLRGGGGGWGWGVAGVEPFCDLIRPFQRPGSGPGSGHIPGAGETDVAGWRQSTLGRGPVQCVQGQDPERATPSSFMNQKEGPANGIQDSHREGTWPLGDRAAALGSRSL